MANTPISIRLPDDLRAWLDERAEQENRSINNLVVTLLQQVKSADKKGRK